MDGIHLLGEWYGCPADTPEFTRADKLRTVCLDAVAASLNNRPRQTLGWMKPSEKLAELVAMTG